MVKKQSDERYCRYFVDVLVSADYETEIMAYIDYVFVVLHRQRTLQGYWLPSRTGACTCRASGKTEQTDSLDQKSKNENCL